MPSKAALAAASKILRSAFRRPRRISPVDAELLVETAHGGKAGKGQVKAVASPGKVDAMSESIGLLISLLVRYPEVGTINYEPKTRVLKFTFIVKEALAPEKVAALKKKLSSCLGAFAFLTKKGRRLASLEASTHENFTFLEIKRDVASLTEEEISLIIGLMREEFGQSLITEQNDPLLEEELLAEGDLIGHMLENVKEKTPEKRLIAFREEGKVLVFANRNRV